MRHPLLLVPLAFFLSACVYTSPVPLGDPASAPLDEALVGEWVGAPDDDGDVDSATITVRRFNEHEYLVEWREWVCREYRLPELQNRRLRAFITPVDSVRFLNIQDIAGDTAYMLARYTASPGELRLRFIADEEGKRVLRGTHRTPAAMREAVRANLNEDFYGDELVLVRPMSFRRMGR